jgi:hypothetical protein
LGEQADKSNAQESTAPQDLAVGRQVHVVWLVGRRSRAGERHCVDDLSVARRVLVEVDHRQEVGDGVNDVLGPDVEVLLPAIVIAVVVVVGAGGSGA